MTDAAEQAPLCVDMTKAFNEVTPKFHINFEEYIHFLNELDMTYEQKIEFVETMWQFALRFVEMGFGADSLSITCGEQEENTR